MPEMHPVGDTPDLLLQPARLVRAWAVLLLLALAWDASGLDAVLLAQIGTPTGFPLRHHGLLKDVLHDGLRQAAWVFYALLLLWALWPGLPLAQRVSRRERWTVLLSVALCLLAVGLLKQMSRTSCPWEWQAFGGQALPVSHWNLLQSDGGSGRCFPSGHASSALAFLALCLPWLSPLQPGPHGLAAGGVAGAGAGAGEGEGKGEGRGGTAGEAVGWVVLALVLAGGLLTGAVQTLRGAHAPSHTLWTAVVCGAVTLLVWRLAGTGVRQPAGLALAGQEEGPALRP